MAARDRFVLGQPAQSTLQRYIQSACDPSNYEPNLALDLEIADLINSKKGNAPREAAVAIVNYINHRNPNVSLLALTLLDICVKNCGYPFHLQISTKDFLNELVRRFPERPPMRPTRVQMKTLEAIEEWRQTICQNSRYKDDLGYIRDMHRLLSYKGYMFPEITREDAAVLNASDNLKSAEELEEEERAAQSAKLQELIRRGGPEDLQEANRLMKIMAGYDTKHRTDYRAKAAEEVAKIQQKAKILEEMLQSHTKDDKIAEGDLYEELANALQSAQPKIQKMCEEESEDTEAVAKLFEINDSIHRTLERFKLVKKGDYDAAAKIPKGTLGTSTGVSKTADNELSLIDLGGDSEPSLNGTNNSTAKAAKAANPKAGSLDDDLLGLSLDDSTYGQGGGITLGPSLGPWPSGLPSTTPPPPSAGRPGPPSTLSQTSVPATQPASSTVSANYSPFASSAGPPGPQAVSPPTDPFAAIAAMPPRQPSPFTFPQPPPPKQAMNVAPTQSNIAATGDTEEWAFASALPEPANDLPTSSVITVTNSTINVVFAVSRPTPTDATLHLLARFSNNVAQVVSEMHFQVAVTRGYSLTLKPQSGRTLLPHQRNGITQEMQLGGVVRGQGNAVKVRWKLSYRVGTEAKMREEQGEVAGLGVA
ncbi:MAG: hypothetical protein M1816_007910 [Peltula sp. TS41687]|nr:MAG: hypothetical protein M1816_007910 [Peltula sp. TS41687]